MKVTILTENTVYKRKLLGEYGLSLLLETEGKRYLFDMGQTGVFLQNAETMKVDLEALDGIILSHGHYDHCGGMQYWARKQETSEESNPRIPIYINRKSFDKKYSQHPATGEMQFSGIPEEAEAWMKEKGKLIFPEDGCAQVSENVYLLSQVPYVTDFESISARFWKETHDSLEHQLSPDTMEDEQMLVIREQQGLCVFTGCAHPGIVNCLQYVQSSFQGEHIHSLVAGMHLKGCKPLQLQKTLAFLKELEIDVVIPLHCTGMIAIAAIKEALGERCVLAEVGKKITL